MSNLKRKETKQRNIAQGMRYVAGSTQKISYSTPLYFYEGIHLGLLPLDIEGQNTPILMFQCLYCRYPALQGPFPTISMWQNLRQAIRKPITTMNPIWSRVMSQQSASATPKNRGEYGLPPSNVQLTMATTITTPQKQCLCYCSMRIMLSRQKRKRRNFSKGKNLTRIVDIQPLAGQLITESIIRNQTIFLFEQKQGKVLSFVDGSKNK